VEIVVLAHMRTRSVLKSTARSKLRACR